MRTLSTQLRGRYNPSKASVRSETASAAATDTTTTSATAQSSLPSSKFSWPSGNAYDNNRTDGNNIGNKSKEIPATKNASTHSSSSSKPLFARNEKRARDVFPPPPLSPPTPDVANDDNNVDVGDVSAATSVTARALHMAAQHCVRGQEFMSSASASPSPSSATSPLHASIKEYQSALYILEKTIGSGFADRRECRSLQVMSQIFYWMGLAFQKLAACRRNESLSKYRTKPSDDTDAAIEKHERNAIQSFVSCLRLRYHLLDRSDEARDESETDENVGLLERFVSPLMEVQLVLTNLWESSPSPFCNMTPLESARKLQRLRIATWNEDKGDEFMFAIAVESVASSAFSNLHKALAHYRKALETFSDENHKSDILRLKIASCYRQWGLRKKNNGNDDGASADFDAAVFWYRSALKAFCATVRFASPASETAPSTPTPQKSSAHPQSPTPSVSSIDMSTCSFDDEGNACINLEAIMTKHPTYERILVRIEEILSWKQHQQQRQKQKQKFKKNKGGVSGTEGTTIDQETTMRNYLRSKMKESISHQIRAESMLSPTAAWRRKPSKSLYLLSEGVKLSDEAASTMSSMSVLANALIILRASVRIEEAVWGPMHPIVQSIHEKIDAADEEYLDTEEQHAEAAENTQRVQKTTSKTKEYNDFHKLVENLVEENKRLRNVLDDSTGNMETSQTSHSLQQKSLEPSNDKAVSAIDLISPLQKPVEYVNIVPSQIIDEKISRLPLDTQGDVTKQNFPANYFVQSNSVNPEIRSTNDDKFERFMNRCKSLEEELKDANDKIRLLNQKVQKKKTSQNVTREIKQSQQLLHEQHLHRNDHLEKRCRELEDELKISSDLLENLSEQYRTLEAKLEDQVSIQSENSADAQKAKEENTILTNRLARINAELKASKSSSDVLQKKLEGKYETVSKKLEEVESDLQSSKNRCVELRTLEAKALEEKAEIKSESEAYADRCVKAEADLELAKKRCAELETNREKREVDDLIQEDKTRLETENEKLLSRCTVAESELKISNARNIELESNLGKLREMMESIEDKVVETKFDLPLSLEKPETSAGEKSIPEGSSEQNEKVLREENNRLQNMCKALEKDMVLTKDQSEKLALELRDEVTRVEGELRSSKDEYAKLKSELDGMKKIEMDEKSNLITRVSQLEQDIEQLSKEGEETKSKFEKERDELNEKMEKEQQLHSVMVQEHELTVIALKKDIESAEQNQKEREQRANEIEEELDEAKLSEKKAKAILPSKDSMNMTEFVNDKESIGNDNLSPERDRDVSERVHAIEKESLTNRIAELRKELEIAKEKAKIENEKLEGELSEKLEKEKNRVKELEVIVEDGNQAYKEAIASRVANLKAENDSIEQQLKDVTEEREKELNNAQILQTRVSELENGAETDKTEYDELKSRFTELEKGNQVTAEELREMTEMKEQATNELQNLRDHISKLEKNIGESKSQLDEQKQLRETISKLKSQLQEMSEENDNISSQLRSIDSTHKVKMEKYDFVVARCVELEKELENTTKTEGGRQEILTKKVDELEQKLELSTKKNSEVSLNLQSIASDLKKEKELHDKVKEENWNLSEKYDRIENEAKEFQLAANKNAAIAGKRILTLIKSLNEATAGNSLSVQPVQKDLMNRNIGRGNKGNSSKNEDETNQTNHAKQFDDLKAELATTKEYNENLKHTIESYVQEKKKLLEQATSLDKKLAFLEEKKAIGEHENVERLKRQLETVLEKQNEEQKVLAEQISTLEKAKGKTDELNKKLTLDLETSDSKTKQLQLALESRESKFEQSVKKISALEYELDSVNARNKIFVSENESTEKEALKFQSKIEQNEEEYDRLLEKLASLEKALDLSKSKNEELLTKVESFDTERENLALSLKENDAERQDFVARVSVLQKEVDSKCAENDALSLKMLSFHEVKEENELLSSRVSKLEEKLKSSSEENMRLSEKIELLKNSEVDKEEQGSRIVALENELKSARETNTQLSADVESLKSQKEDAEQLKSHISKILESLLASSIESLKTKEEDNHRLTDRLADLEKYIDEAKSTKRDLIAHVQALEKNEEAHQRTLGRLSEVETELERFEGSRKSLETDNESFEKQKEQMIGEISNLKEELETSKEKNQALLDAWSRTLETQQENYGDKISGLMMQLETSEKTNAGLIADIGSLSEDQKVLVSKISDLEKELDESKSANQTLSAENKLLKSQQEDDQHSVDRVSDVAKELHDANERNKTLTADLECLEKQNQEYEQMKSQVSTLEKEIENANNDLNSQYELVQEKMSEIKDLANQLEKLKDDLDLARQKNHLLFEEKMSLDSTYSSMNTDLNHAKEENRTLQARCIEQDNELKVLRDEINEVKIKAENDKKSLVEQYDDDRKQNEQISVRCKDLESLVKESTEENKEITSLLRQKSSQIEALNQTIDSMEDVNEKASEYDFMANQCKELEDELLKTMDYNEELKGEINLLKEDMDTLNMTIFDTEADLKDQAEELQNAQKSNKGLEKRCASLKKELNDVKDQYKKLEEKIAYPDSVEDGHEWTRLQLAELENRMDEAKKENEVLENRMEDVMDENELLLSRLQEYKEKLEHQKSVETTKNDENLVNVCKELEKELVATVEINDDLKEKVEAFEKQIEDWKKYSETLENELEEESEALQDAEQKNADLLTATDILEQHLQEAHEQREKLTSEADQNKDNVAQLLQMQGDEYARIADKCSQLETDLQDAKKEYDEAKKNVESLTAEKEDLQNLLEEAVQDIHELEESTDKLNAVILAKNEMKRLLDRAELGRDEINEKYGRCKKELNAAKEHLDEAHAEKEELIRKLDIEKQVSMAYKSEDENEFDELYRNARKEMNEMEIILDESRSCVTDLEENVEILQHQLQAALTFKLQQPKAKPNRKFFGWRGANRIENKESNPTVVTDDDMEDYEKEVVVDEEQF